MNYYFKPIEKNLYNLLLENFDNKLQENDYIIYSDLIRKIDKYLNNYLYLFEDNLDDIINNTKERNLRLQSINKALESLFDIKNKFDRFNFDSFLKILINQKEIIANINEKNQIEIEKQKIFDSLDVYKNDQNKKLIENIKEKLNTLLYNVP